MPPTKTVEEMYNEIAAKIESISEQTLRIKGERNKLATAMLHIFLLVNGRTTVTERAIYDIIKQVVLPDA